MKLITFALLLVLNLTVNAQYKVEVLDSATFHKGEGVVLNKTSFRGLSVVDDHTVWVSGSRGTIGRSTDGGASFTFIQLKGYEKSDFRDIEAFDGQKAIIMSSGTPAYILKTTDGGETWKEVYKNTDTAYFLDAMDFWNEQNGMIVGDPVGGYFVLLQTKNGGESWQQVHAAYSPKAMEGEAVFAASGTSLRCKYDSVVVFGSGGKSSRLFYSSDKGKNWMILPGKLISGEASQGIFSVLLTDNYNWVYFTGGDYRNDSAVMNNSGSMDVSHQKVFKGGILWKSSYQSCIEDGLAHAYVSCGTKGVYLLDFKKGSMKISDEGFHVVRKAKKGKAVFLAGPNGKIGIMR